MTRPGSAADSPGVRIPPPLSYVAGLAGAWLMESLVPMPPVGGDWRSTLGWTLVAFGGVLFLWCVALFKLAGTALRPSRPSLAFVKRGPYRFSQNPIYLGFTLIALGVAWLNFPVWGTAAVVGSAAWIHYCVILREESYLQSRFGPDYESYRRTVRRWI